MTATVINGHVMMTSRATTTTTVHNNNNSGGPGPQQQLVNNGQHQQQQYINVPSASGGSGGVEHLQHQLMSHQLHHQPSSTSCSQQQPLTTQQQHQRVQMTTNNDGASSNINGVQVAPSDGLVDSIVSSVVDRNYNHHQAINHHVVGNGMATAPGVANGVVTPPVSVAAHVQGANGHLLSVAVPGEVIEKPTMPKAPMTA